MTATSHRSPPSDLELRVKALESLLTEKGLVDGATIGAIVDHYETKVGPHRGAQIVARAWSEPEFKARLLQDGAATLAELGFADFTTTHLVVKENLPRVHNLVVCTLCSCYPWSVLGLPPTWYKSAPYRARAVRDPRGLLHEFGLELGKDVAIHVWDSTADVRYLVLPMRPHGTDGMSADELAGLVSRDAMIGTAVVAAPAG